MATSVRVLSYNIHKGIGTDGTLDLTRTADLVRETDADIVGLQEVDRHFRDGTRYADQFAILRDRLEMAGVYAPAIERDPIRQSHGNPRQYGIGVLSRYPIQSSRTHALTRDPDTEPRVLLDTTVDCDGILLSVATTHLSLNDATRRKQVADVLAATDRDRQMLVGDFNATPDSVPVEALTEVFVDTFEDCGVDDRLTFPSPYGEDGARTSDPEQCIDYVFCTPDISIRSVDVIESPASDHSAVATTIDLDTRNGT